jgi:hypothetical protein
MSYTATSVCFYCSNPINRNTQPYVHANIRHHYKHGGTRDSDRNFHPACFEKFEDEDGRPFNPETRYKVLHAERVTGDERVLLTESCPDCDCVRHYVPYDSDQRETEL